MDRASWRAIVDGVTKELGTKQLKTKANKAVLSPELENSSTDFAAQVLCAVCPPAPSTSSLSSLFMSFIMICLSVLSSHLLPAFRCLLFSGTLYLISQCLHLYIRKK